MRTLMLFGFCVLYASCTPDANNPTRASAPSLPSTDSGNQNNDPKPTPSPDPTPTDTPTPGDPGTVPDPIPDILKDCKVGDVPGNAHALLVQKDEASGQYLMSFANAKDSGLHIISLYVTGKDDALPIFPKFEFKGSAYWMVSVDDPFEEYFTLPVTYGSLPKAGVDVTVRYKGQAQGAALGALTEPTCVKFSVITFEPETASTFQTSAYWVAHRP